MLNPSLLNEINQIPGFENKKAFAGAFVTKPNGRMAARPIKFVTPGTNKKYSLDYILDAVGLKDGMTISFHHCLRNGDAVMLYVIDAIAKKGIRDLTLAVSSLSAVQDCLLPYFEQGVITAIDTSGNRGKLGAYVQQGKLKKPAIYRTHGGRARAIETGELHINVAFIAAPCCDKYGNINGVQGKSACGSLGYAMPDAEYADFVVAVTDGYTETALDYVSIPQTQVDYITEVDSIGDPSGIATGSIRVSKSPAELVISKYAADVIAATEYFRDGMVFQFGSGGMAIATASFIREKMLQDNIVASAGVGGVSGFHVQMLNEGLIKTFYDPQDFDVTAIQSLGTNPRHHEISASAYANPFSANPYVNMLDFAVLSATEIDVDFNVNVLTDSYGKLLGAPGGHPDAAAGAKLTVLTMPLLRNRLPMLLDHVSTIVTPGESIDILVTEYGIAVNPRRQDVTDMLRGKALPIKSMEELKAKADKLTGKATPVEFSGKLCGLVEYRDGTIIDVIHQI
ncbi:MAG: citrate lyase subunit alpha [Acidaminococcaceae bacterium]|nr:citrate lyase subunit alpha [Acidaminococcaceae bacterium]